MKDILDKVIAFATEAHGEQMRKFSPDRYIVHPIRVMKICRQYTSDLAVLAAAVLHDVLEDTPITPKDMQHFLNAVMDERNAARTMQLVIELTDVYVKKDYPWLNRRTRKQKEIERLIKTSAASQTIKYADIIDNTGELPQEDEDDFGYVFLSECRHLLSKLNGGNPSLYKKAVDCVNEKLLAIRK